MVAQVLHLSDQRVHRQLQGLALLLELREAGLSGEAWEGGDPSGDRTRPHRPHQLQGGTHLLPGQLAGQLHGLQVLLQIGSQLPSLALLQVSLGVPGG